MSHEVKTFKLAIDVILVIIARWFLYLNTDFDLEEGKMHPAK
jgi:hypothetical protein